MKKLLTLALCALATHPVLATHLYSAYISYELVDANKLEYNITVTTFADVRGEGEHKQEIELLLGYGSPEASVTATIDPDEEKVLVDERVVRNKYRITHRFPEAGICYSIKYIASNYSSSILNIESPTNTPMEVSTELCPNQKLAFSKAPLINDSLIIYASTNEQLEFNTKARDFEGDILELSLITEGEKYTSPKKFGSDGGVYKISNKSILWDKPVRVGAYQIRFQVDEYRNIDGEKTKLGSIEVFVMVFVLQGTGIEDIPEKLRLHYGQGALHFKELEFPATARIVNLTGQILSQHQLEAGQNHLPIETNGSPFVVVIESKSGLVQRKLIYQ